MSSRGRRQGFKARGDARGVSVLLLTIMTIIVMLVLGLFMVLMVVNVTPSGVPAVGALSSSRNHSDNYTFTISAVHRGQVWVVVYPYNSTLFVSNITGAGEFLSQGDSFTIGDLEPGT